MFKLFSAVATTLPESVALRLGAFIGWVGGSVLRIRRAAVAEHLGLAFPEESTTWRRRVADASYAHLGREAVATLRLSGQAGREVVARTTMSGFERLEEALASGRGVILLTGHLGNWEVGGAAFVARGIELDAISKGVANLRVGDALAGVRQRFGIGLIDVADARSEVPRSLDEGRVVGIVADQNVHRGGIFVPFFGRLAATARGPARFAVHQAAPVFLAVALCEPGWRSSYTVSIQQIDFEPTGDVDADVDALTRAHCEALERAVRAAPEQYFWQHKRWKRRPESEEAIA